MLKISLKWIIKSEQHSITPLVNKTFPTTLINLSHPKQTLHVTIATRVSLSKVIKKLFYSLLKTLKVPLCTKMRIKKKFKQLKSSQKALFCLISFSHFKLQNCPSLNNSLDKHDKIGIANGG